MIETFYFITAITSCLVTGLQDVRVTVPKASRRGDSVVLHCHYDLEDDVLQAVKWYKEGKEFFRYIPEEKPPWKLFHILKLPELEVDTAKSNETQVYLTHVTSAMTGDYGCEVFLDSPSYQREFMASHMEVVEVPLQPPILTVSNSKVYRSRDTLKADCTASPSRPAVNLTWGLNGENVNPKWVKQYRRVVDKYPDLEESVSVLEVTLKGYHVTSGKLKVRCTASLYDLYWQTTEAMVNTDKEMATDDKSIWDDYYDEYDPENDFGVEELPKTARGLRTTRPDDSFNFLILGLFLLFTTLNVTAPNILVL